MHHGGLLLYFDILEYWILDTILDTILEAGVQN